MRHYDIPYVQNTSAPSIPMVSDINSLDLKTIVKYHLCGKSHGKVSECRKCPAQCAYGKRALELMYPPQNAFAGPKLIDNKTLLELAREEIAKQQEVKPKPAAEKPKKRKIPAEEWYNKAYESENPLQYIMDTFGITEHKAKAKVYEAWHRHPELKEKPLWEPKTKQKSAEKKPASVQEKTAVEPDPKPSVESVAETAPAAPPAKSSDGLLAPLEGKINELMNQQEEYKSKYEHYLKLYNDTKAKVNALYEALTILNE